jgi:hypothetical protein
LHVWNAPKPFLIHAFLRARSRFLDVQRRTRRSAVPTTPRIELSFSNTLPDSNGIDD